MTPAETTRRSVQAGAAASPAVSPTAMLIASVYLASLRWARPRAVWVGFARADGCEGERGDGFEVAGEEVSRDGGEPRHWARRRESPCRGGLPRRDRRPARAFARRARGRNRPRGRNAAFAPRRRLDGAGCAAARS